MRSFRILSLVAVAVGVVAGCSVVNSYDDVKQPQETGYTAGPKTEAPLAEAGPSTTSDAGTDAPSDASAPTTDHAVLVVAGEIDSADATDVRFPVLTVLDPNTGEEIAKRESMHIAGLAHEAERDLWYIFEAPSSFVTSPSDVVALHIRTFDAKTGAWTELSKTDLPPLFYYNAIAVTTKRLTFVAHAATDGGPMRMITLDTSNPAAPTEVADNGGVPLSTPPIGLVATPGGSGPGGRISVLNVGSNAPDAGECEAGVCSAKVRHFFLPNNGPPEELDPVLFGGMASFGVPAYASVVCKGQPDDVYVLPAAGTGAMTVHMFASDYSPSTGTGGVYTGNLSFSMNAGSSLLRRAAIDNVHRLAFVVEANTDTNMYAIPLDVVDAGRVPTKVAIRHSGQSVYYDPASETAFAPFNQGDGKTFGAFKVNVGSNGVIELTERVAGQGDWKPPADLRPILLGIHDPPSYTCQ